MSSLDFGIEIAEADRFCRLLEAPRFNPATMRDESLWRETTRPRFLHKPLPTGVDVAVVGGGITGLTAAYLLKRAGKRVAVFERDQVGTGETGNTSAHLTCVTDTRIGDLAKRFGDTAAWLAWRGGEMAIDLIESIVERGIDCGFRRVPGFLCAPFFDDENPIKTIDGLRNDADVANRLGFTARFLESGPLTGKPAITFADQALFHPMKYLDGLAKFIDGDGSFVCEDAEVGDMRDDPLAVVVNGETIACRDIVVATNVPLAGLRSFLGASLLQTKLTSYSTYIVGARLDAGTHAAGLYSDTANPYYYLRVHDDADAQYAIFGGADHKTGQVADTTACFDQVANALCRLLPKARLERRWSGLVIETDDGLPFIGKVADHQYVATGYAGNGLTFGSLAGLMLHDAITATPNPWRDLLDPHRKPTSLDALKTLAAENVDYAYYWIADRLRLRDRSGIESVARGDGKVLKIDGRRVAVHRKSDGEVVKVSAVCTHLGCLVRWNAAESVWDCPCHGSRFSPEGQVVSGPAERGLERIE